MQRWPLMWGLLGAALTVTSPALAGERSSASRPGAQAAPAARRPAAGGSRSTPERDVVGACLEDHARGQELQLGEKLLDARDTFLRCSASLCPSEIQRDCLGYLEQVRTQIPSVVLRVTADGVSRGDVKVFVDGRLVLEELTGKALELDPGRHDVRVVLPPYTPYAQPLVVSEGDRFRVLEVAFRSDASAADVSSAAPPELPRPIPTWSYVFAGVSAAALVSGVGWGLSSRALKRKLETDCSPRCSPASVEVLRERALLADVSWVVAAASLITAGVFYFTRPELPADADGRLQLGLSQLNEHGAVGTLRLSAF